MELVNLRRVLGLMVALMLMYGCGSGQSGKTGGENMDPREQLAGRPSFEQAEQEYVALLKEAVAAARRVAPSVEWDKQDPAPLGGVSGCRAPFSDVEGAFSSGYVTGGIGSIPDEDWDAAADAVAEVARRYGFDTRTTVVDEPGEHLEAYGGPYGDDLQVQSSKQTIFQLNGGCFLKASGPGETSH